MASRFSKGDQALIMSAGIKIVQIEPWEIDSMRVRGTKDAAIADSWKDIGSLLDQENLVSDIEIAEVFANLLNY